MLPIQVFHLFMQLQWKRKALDQRRLVRGPWYKESHLCSATWNQGKYLIENWEETQLESTSDHFPVEVVHLPMIRRLLLVKDQTWLWKSRSTSLQRDGILCRKSRTLRKQTQQIDAFCIILYPHITEILKWKGPIWIQGVRSSSTAWDQ